MSAYRVIVRNDNYLWQDFPREVAGGSLKTEADAAAFALQGLSSEWYVHSVGPSKFIVVDD